MAAGGWGCGNHFLAQVRGTALQQAQRNGFAHRLAEGGGGHMAASVALDRVAGKKQNGSVAWRLAFIHRLQSDQRGPIRACQMRAVAQGTTPKAFGLTGHTACAQVIQRGASIHFGSDHVAFFDPQRAQCLQPIGPHLPWLSAGEHMFPDAQAVVRGREDFKRQLAREGQPQDAQGHAFQRAAAVGVNEPHKGQGGVAQVQMREGGSQGLTRLRSCHAHRRPLVCDRSHRDPQFRPHHLQQKLQMAHHLGRLGCGGGHEKLRFADARGGAVVEHDAVFAQHESVTRFADRQLGKTIDVDAV